MGNSSKATLPVSVSISPNDQGGYKGTYSGTGSPSSGGGKAAPTVASDGNITVHEDTNITFTIENEGWTFPTASGATLIEIKVGNATTFTSFTAGSKQGNFTVSAPTNGGKDLELEDADEDATTAGVPHQFCLQVVNGNTTYGLDPNFWNRF